MNSESASYRRILWATSVVGGATLGALLIGLLRNKAVALIGGPEAIGLLGLFTTLVATLAAIATLGLDTSVVRLLSKDVDEPGKAAKVRYAAWSLAWPLSLFGAAAAWFFRMPLAELVLGDRSLADEVGWLALGVPASVLAAVQLAIMQSYGRIKDVARVRLWGSLASTMVGVAAVYHMGIAGILVAVLAVPIANLALASWLAMRVAKNGRGHPTQQELFGHWRQLFSVGAMIMLNYAVLNLTGLGGRAIVTQRLGLDAAGLYQASNAILSVNLTLILNAMAADYYPRLAQVAENAKATTALVNQQLHVSFMLAAPALIIASAAATPLLQLLYSSEFTESAFLLRLFVAAGVPRLALWAFGYALLARGATFAFLMGEVAGATFVPLTWLLVPTFGLPGAGVAAVISTAASFGVYLWFARSFDVRMSARSLRDYACLFSFLLGLAYVFEANMWAGVIFGAAAAAAVAARSIGELRGILSR